MLNVFCTPYLCGNSTDLRRDILYVMRNFVFSSTNTHYKGNEKCSRRASPNVIQRMHSMYKYVFKLSYFSGKNGCRLPLMPILYKL
jgi:hypothetical protein